MAASGRLLLSKLLLLVSVLVCIVKGGVFTLRSPATLQYELGVPRLPARATRSGIKISTPLDAQYSIHSA